VPDELTGAPAWGKVKKMNPADYEQWLKMVAPGALTKSKGGRIVLDPAVPGRLALEPADSLMLGDSAWLFWHGSEWRRGEVMGYDRDTVTGDPVARVQLKPSTKAPGASIDIRVGAWAMREPLPAKPRPTAWTKPMQRAKSYDGAAVVDDMTTDELRGLLTVAIDRAVKQAMQAAGMRPRM
jgi:hypothetical protein